MLTTKPLKSNKKPIVKQPISAEPAKPKPTAISCDQYSDQQLAEVYNQARVDYIVPMPMNAKRMREYIDNYDLDLEASIVARNLEGMDAGIGMLGLRDERSWITRLGVAPHNRGLRVGQFLMDELLQKSHDKGVSFVQLEVIVGNEPAFRLFQKLGFEETRELMIIRRPPGKFVTNDALDNLTTTTIDDSDIPTYLAKRETGASWVEETASLLNAGSLRGVTVTLADGREGWVIFQRQAFQLSHFVLCDTQDQDVLDAVLYHAHKAFPMQDAKIENVPVGHHTWQAYQKMGYMEVFRRTEMLLSLE